MTEEKLKKKLTNYQRGSCKNCTLAHPSTLACGCEHRASFLCPKDIDQILALFKDYKSPEQIALMFNPDYLDFKKGVEEGRRLEREQLKAEGWVKLSKDQTTPSINEWKYDDDATLKGYGMAQQDMLKAKFKKVEE